MSNFYTVVLIIFYLSLVDVAQARDTEREQTDACASFTLALSMSCVQIKLLMYFCT